LQSQMIECCRSTYNLWCCVDAIATVNT
jgi:hypothetical protein